MVFPGGASIEPALEASAAMYLSYARIRMQLIRPPSPVKVKLPFRGSFLLVVSPPHFPSVAADSPDAQRGLCLNTGRIISLVQATSFSPGDSLIDDQVWQQHSAPSVLQTVTTEICWTAQRRSFSAMKV